MQRIVKWLPLRALRLLSLIVLAVVGTTLLMQVAPGYLTDEREMDSRYASQAKVSLENEQLQSGSLGVSLATTAKGWLRGDLGTSRQYQVPVTQLVRERLSVTALLIGEALLIGWLASFSLALILSTRKKLVGEGVIAITTTGLLCLPVGLLATACLVLNCGGPVFVLATLVTVRDFKLVYRVLRSAAQAPTLLYARSQGYSLGRSVWVHLLYTLRGELLALFMMSLVVALSAAVPVEVIFDKPGLGQLAWSAAMNRDLPVLLAVTLFMAAIVGVSGLLMEQSGHQQAHACG